MNPSDLLYVLALQHVPNLGDSSAKKLIRRLGSAEAVIKEKPQNLLKIDGIGKTKLKEFRSEIHLKAAEEELKFIEDNKIKTHYFQD